LRQRIGHAIALQVGARLVNDLLACVGMIFHHPIEQRRPNVKADPFENIQFGNRAVAVVKDFFIPIVVRRCSGLLRDLSRQRIFAGGLIKMSVNT
jgi:hypothetical protein